MLYLLVVVTTCRTFRRAEIVHVPGGSGSSFVVRGPYTSGPSGFESRRWRRTSHIVLQSVVSSMVESGITSHGLREHINCNLVCYHAVTRPKNFRGAVALIFYIQWSTIYCRVCDFMCACDEDGRSCRDNNSNVLSACKQT